MIKASWTTPALLILKRQDLMPNPSGIFAIPSFFCGPRSRLRCALSMRVFFEEVRRGQESILSLRGLADFGDFGWRDHWSVIAESVPHVGQDSSDFFVVELPKGWRGK